jgi:competence CoiA-like predicted nuclease
MLKRGTKRQWHFAHYSYSNCDTYHEPESDLHLAGRRDLYTHFKAIGQRVSLEMYFPEIKQRADLCIRDNPLTKVLEFQCASVPGEQILTRSQGYLSQGVEALWLMGSSRLKRKGTMFRLTEMEQYFIRSSHSRSNHPFMSPYLVYYYCPVTRKLLIIDHIQAFSKTLFYGSFHFKPLSEIRLHHLFSPVLSSHDFSSQIRLYLNRKASYRLRPHKYFSFAERTVRQLWYEKGISPSLHPSWVGLPHSDYTSFDTSALLWQGWIFAK